MICSLKMTQKQRRRVERVFGKGDGKLVKDFLPAGRSGNFIYAVTVSQHPDKVKIGRTKSWKARRHAYANWNLAAGDAIEIDVSLEAAPAVLYDALVLPDGADAVKALLADGRTLEFVKDQYRHCKPILVMGASDQLLEACGIRAVLPDGQPDPGLILASKTRTAADGFIAAIAKHRHFARETDPPRI